MTTMKTAVSLQSSITNNHIRKKLRREALPEGPVYIKLRTIQQLEQISDRM